MKLLTQEIIKRFEQIGSQEDKENPIVVVKFFNPTGRGTWFATEYDAEKKLLFGYVSLFNQPGMDEFGYFSLEELESIRGQFGLGIERDAYASEKTLNEWKIQMQLV